MSKKVILWDCDGTLMYANESFYQSLSRSIAEADCNIQESEIRTFLKESCSWHNTAIPHIDEVGEKWWEALFEKLCAFCGKHGIKSETSRNICKKFKEYVISFDYKLYEDAKEVLAYCKALGYENYILSNNFPELSEVIDRMEIGEYITKCFLSANIGYEKPRCEIYQYVLSQLGDMDVCYMVGDNPITDIKAGNEAGLKTILVHNDVDDSEASYVCKSLSEIKDIIKFPKSIQDLIEGKRYKLDDIGMSSSKVYIFDDMVLKIQETTEVTKTEYQIMSWEAVKGLVPKVLAYEVVGSVSYLLMSKMDGKMLCDEEYMNNPQKLVKIMAEGLKRLWSINVSNCPCDYRLYKKLEMAEYNVENGLVDMDNIQPDTYGEEGFANPKELLKWLYDNQPEEEITLTHGDYCLPNIFGQDEEFKGFIDVGKMGKADKWQDIAIGYRTLKNKIKGAYVGDMYEKFDPNMLFEELGIEPDWEKIRYYILMDELF